MKEKLLDKDTIDAHHAYVQSEIRSDLNSIALGPGRLPTNIAIGLAVVGFISFIIGVLLVALRMQFVYFWDWNNQFVGPFFFILFLFCCGGATYLVTVATRRSNRFRRELYFHPLGDYGIAAVHKDDLVHEHEMKSDLKSGTTPHKSIMPRSEAYSMTNLARTDRRGHHNQAYRQGPGDPHRHHGDHRRGPPDDRRRGPHPDERRRGPPPGGRPPPDYREYPPEGRRGPPPGDYKRPPPDDRRGPPRDDRRGPPRDDRRGPPRDESRGPPRDESRGPPRDDRRGPPRDDRRGPPRDDRRGPPDDQRRPSPEEEKRGPPREGRQPRGPPRFAERSPDDVMNKVKLDVSKESESEL
ncbi:RNA-binding protein 12B-like isoform X2 [Pomacea canaliculata]|uniref:RNA-binding protein 12B-like isoform X2 n=1 Tax=Pomacea canaliculata TaxID=400727 RepID=UPI000D73FE99|nr:RNA-binding protein 12B-like isoform X2 [Pomacea canaliculata]